MEKGNNCVSLCSLFLCDVILIKGWPIHYSRSLHYLALLWFEKWLIKLISLERYGGPIITIHYFITGSVHSITPPWKPFMDNDTMIRLLNIALSLSIDLLFYRQSQETSLTFLYFAAYSVKVHIALYHELEMCIISLYQHTAPCPSHSKRCWVNDLTNQCNVCSAAWSKTPDGISRSFFVVWFYSFY